MKGAREYARLFKTGQYGKLYIVSGSHARGLTFRIQILPEGVIAISNGENNLCINKNAVEVYGVISGQLGWTEEYGWIHKGKWQDDFKKLLKDKKDDILSNERMKEIIAKEFYINRQEEISRLLESY